MLIQKPGTMINRSFLIRYNKHLQALPNNSCNSKFTEYVLEQKHCMDTTENAMEILHTIRKRSHLNTIEKFYIVRDSK